MSTTKRPNFTFSVYQDFLFSLFFHHTKYRKAFSFQIYVSNFKKNWLVWLLLFFKISLRSWKQNWEEGIEVSICPLFPHMPPLLSASSRKLLHLLQLMRLQGLTASPRPYSYPRVPSSTLEGLERCINDMNPSLSALKC